MKRRIVTGFTDLYIAKKTKDGFYEPPVKLRGSRSVVFQVNREIKTIKIGKNQVEKDIVNKISSISIETEVYDPSFEILKMLEHNNYECDEFSGITTSSASKNNEYAVMLIRTDNYNKKEYLILYNSTVKILDTIDSEVHGAKPYLLTGKAVADKNDILRYLNQEENIDVTRREEFDMLFKSSVYYPFKF